MAQKKLDNLSMERSLVTAGAAVLYLRVASRNQHDQSYGIARQREACMREAERLGAVIVGEFVDVGVSGNTSNRSGLGGLLRRITTRPIKYVITSDAGRLARNPGLYRSIRQRLDRAGAMLRFADGGARCNVSAVDLLWRPL